jgi:alpha-glucosidase (family GH31 glycosyl hydrolase)
MKKILFTPTILVFALLTSCSTLHVASKRGPASDLPSNSAPILIGNARFTILTAQAIRMEYSPTKTFVDDPSLFATDRAPQLTADELAALKITTTTVNAQSVLTIDTGKMVFTYVNDGQAFHYGNPTAQITAANGHAFPAWTYGKVSTTNLGGTRNSLDHIDLDTTPAPVTDGLLTRDGWYYVDDGWRLLVGGPDIDTGWIKQRSPNTDTLDGYFFGYGQDYKGALQSLTRVSGQAPLPRRYTMGAWYSRWWPYTSTDYRTIVQQFHDHDFPLDMVVMDMNWHRQTDYTGLSWNRVLLPDAEQLMIDFHHAGLHVTLNDHPQGGVAPDEDTYAQFMNAMGADPSTQQTIPYDAGNQKYIETLLNITHTNLEKVGVDFWWLDWMGDSSHTFNQMGWMNELYYRHSENSIPEKNLRGESFSRWADWGDQRHPIHFSGDTYIEWSNLQYEVPFTANSGNVGCFFWTHDIGGFIDKDIPGVINQTLDGELVSRWAQFGSMSAVLRLHSANRAYLDKRPWTISSDAETSMHASFHLRSQLFPYIYSSAWQTHDQSVPLVRPLYMEFPNVDQAYQNGQEYLFGDALLVAPIVTKSTDAVKKTSSQKVWFPDGRWFDWFTGAEFAPNTTITAVHDLNSFPLFARGGFPILMQPYQEHMGTTPVGSLIVRVYPGTPGQKQTANLYEDDGETRAYLSGAYSLTEVSYQQNTAQQMKISITPKVAQSTLPANVRPANRNIELQLMASSALKSATLTTAAGPINLPITYDATTNTNHLTLPAQSTDQVLNISASY